MTQSKPTIKRALLVIVTSMLVSAPAPAMAPGAVTSSNKTLSFTFGEVDNQLMVGVLPVKIRHRPKRHWRPQYPSQVGEASWYAPGGPLACGGEYTASDMGVAHKTLPCGTELRICYLAPGHKTGRCVRVRVMDRGPYVAGRVLDLQQAPKERLGFPGLGKVHWAVIAHPHHHRRRKSRKA